MTNIKIEFPAERGDIARAMSRALLEIADETYPRQATVEETPADTTRKSLKTSTAHLDARGKGAEVEESQNTEPEEEDAEPTNQLPADADTGEIAVDDKGVAFSPEYCGKAKIPLYASGKRQGQWKKRKGVSDGDYDSWYEGQLLKDPAADEQQEPDPINTQAAFTNQTQQTESEAVPTDCGSFMGWVSAQQAAGRISQEQVTAAYAQLGIAVTDLFAPNTAEQISQHVASLHGFLSQVAAQA